MMTVFTDNYSGEVSRQRWQQSVGFVFIAMLAMLLLFQETFMSMVSTWLSSDTFSYGFLILPISGWLIWQIRHQLISLSPSPEIRVLPLILIVGCVWLLANLLGVRIIEQFALIGMVVLLVWSILGTPTTKVLLFPLGFLFFLVPLVPLHDAVVFPMMELTVNVAVYLLELTGVPVYMDGTSLELSSGSWTVIKECGGVRYLISSIFLGCLLGYLSYQSLTRRFVFVVFAIALSIVANWLRVYIIIMIGHLSNMKLAVGVDHVLYGWVFFVLLIIVMILIGSIWWEKPQEEVPEANYVPREKQSVLGDSIRKQRFAGTCIAALLAAAIWPGIDTAINRIQVADNRVNLRVPAGVGGWRLDADWIWAWWPRVQRVDGEFYKFYSKGDKVVSLYVGQFKSQRRGVELINSENVVVLKDRPDWHSSQRSSNRTVKLKNSDLRIIQSKVKTTGKRMQGWRKLLIWHWYRFGDIYTSNPYVANYLEIWSRLTGNRRDAALILLATPFNDDMEAGERVLKSFADDMLPEVEKELDRSVNVE